MIKKAIKSFSSLKINTKIQEILILPELCKKTMINKKKNQLTSTFI